MPSKKEELRRFSFDDNRPPNSKLSKLSLDRSSSPLKEQSLDAIEDKTQNKYIDRDAIVEVDEVDSSSHNLSNHVSKFRVFDVI